MEIKSFVKNAGLYAIGTFALRLASFLLIPVYTRSLSMSDYGLLLTLMVTVEIVMIFMGMQMTPAFIRFRQEFESRDLLGRLWGTSIVVKLTGCFVVASLSLAFLLPSVLIKLGRSRDVLPYIAVVCCVTVCMTLHRHMISFYRARNDAAKYNIFSVSTALLTVLLTILVLWVLGMGIKGILIARAISYALVAVYVFAKISRQVRPSFSLAIVPQLLGFGLPLVLSASAWFIMEASDRYFLAHYVGLETVAMYGLGYKVASILLLIVVTPFQLAYGPFTFAVLGGPDADRKLARLFFYLMSALLVVGLGIGATSPLLMRIMAPTEYRQAYLVTLCILPVAAMTGVYLWASALIHITKKTYLIGVTAAMAAGLNLLMNYLLIPRLGWVGAAIATNAAFLFATTGIFILGMQLFPVPLRRQFVPTILSSVNAIRKVMGSLGRVAMILGRRLKMCLTALALRAMRPWHEKRQLTFRPSEVRRVLIWAPFNGLGDAVNGIAMIRAVESAFNSPYISVMASNKSACQVYSALSEVNEVTWAHLSVYRRQLDRSLLRRIRARGYDLMIQDPVAGAPRFLLNLLCFFFSRIPYTVGYSTGPSSMFNTWVLSTNTNEHIVERKLRVVEEILQRPVATDHRFPVTNELKNWARNEVFSALRGKPRRTVVFHTGASEPNFKAWPLPKFIELGRRLVNNCDAAVVLVGSAEEEAMCQPLVEALGDRIASFLGCTVEQTAAVIEQCALFVGNDSGPTHLSACVGTPVAGLYGPTNYVRTRPYGSANRVLRMEFSCSPCWCPIYDWERCVRLTPQRLRCSPAKCLQALEVDLVFAACVAFLNAERPALDLGR